MAEQVFGATHEAMLIPLLMAATISTGLRKTRLARGYWERLATKMARGFIAIAHRAYGSESIQEAAALLLIGDLDAQITVSHSTLLSAHDQAIRYGERSYLAAQALLDKLDAKLSASELYAEILNRLAFVHIAHQCEQHDPASLATFEHSDALLMEAKRILDLTSATRSSVYAHTINNLGLSKALLEQNDAYFEAAAKLFAQLELERLHVGPEF